MSATDKTPEEIAAEDGSADVKAILVIFSAFVLGALFFVSGVSF